jgi:hypothetical protein
MHTLTQTAVSSRGPAFLSASLCFVEAPGDLYSFKKFSLFRYLSSHPKGTPRSGVRIGCNVFSIIFKVQQSEKQA